MTVIPVCFLAHLAAAVETSFEVPRLLGEIEIFALTDSIFVVDLSPLLELFDHSATLSSIKTICIPRSSIWVRKLSSFAKSIILSTVI